MDFVWIFTILQLFFYVSKKLIFRHRKPSSIFFFFFPPNVVRFKFTLFNSARWLLLIEQKKKKRKIISPSKHVTYYQRPPDVCLLYPASKRSLKRLTMERRASFSRFRRELRPGIPLFPAGKIFTGKMEQRPPKNSITADTWSFLRVF